MHLKESHETNINNTESCPQQKESAPTNLHSDFFDSARPGTRKIHGGRKFSKIKVQNVRSNSRYRLKFGRVWQDTYLTRKDRVCTKMQKNWQSRI